jgi:RecB family endonuclease NucS
MHVEGMSVNSRDRRYHPNIKPGSAHDLFYKIGRGEYRLWDPESDPAPIYKDDLEKESQNLPVAEAEESEEETSSEEMAYAGAREFAYERDLQNYLVKNLALVEKGLRVYEEEGIAGVEFPVGGRFIDILAVDSAGGYVVIELKVSRGYDRVVGQLLRYMGWIEKHLSPDRPVRGIIVANEITPDLKLACSRLGDVRLIEYEISFSLRPA